MAEEVKTAAAEGESGSKNFIDAFIEEDIAEGGRFQGQQVHTRFPPEPNGYLHIGHCKALTIDFGTAERFGGLCNLRMDDTNPTKEDVEFVDAIKEDIHWLGFDWGDRFFYGSDYFEKDYEYAVELIKKGLAYVCDLTPEQAREYRGDIGKPAISPYRDRDVEENLDLFERMKNGEFPEGSRTLRAKIDLASGNFNMRDPVIYRIRYMHHHRQGDKWCIYPMYDFAHPIQDALEGITHSLCSLEFEAHRPLYDWVVNNVSVPNKPRQIEFARLGIDHTVMSKRKLRKLVEEGIVSGWDDPRMPTLCGLRRRGFTPTSIRNFCDRIGVAKSASVVEYSFLEHCLREDLNASAERTMGVLHPVKLVITNYPAGKSETFEVENNPTDPSAGTHEITFSRECWIEADDFMAEPLNACKLHAGQIEIARRMREICASSRRLRKRETELYNGDTGEAPTFKHKVQPYYSLRCTPQILGPVLETLEQAEKILVEEFNSVDDNPVVDSKTGTIYHGGNFHGEPMALPFDFLGIAASEIADASERRTERMVNPALSNGLTAFLTTQAGVNSGFMIVQYAAASMVSENKVYAHPASVDSIPSSANQEDIVSMGTTAARKAKMILQNTQDVLADELMTACQAIDIRRRLNTHGQGMTPLHEALYQHVREKVAFYEIDREIWPDIRAVEAMIRSGELLDIVKEYIPDFE